MNKKQRFTVFVIAMVFLMLIAFIFLDFAQTTGHTTAIVVGFVVTTIIAGAIILPKRKEKLVPVKEILPKVKPKATKFDEQVFKDIQSQLKDMEKAIKKINL